MRKNALKLTRLATLLTVSAITFSACIPGTAVQSPTPSPASTPVTQMVQPTAQPTTSALPMDSTASADTIDPVTGVRTITVEAGGFYYKPDEIRIKKGEKVKLVLNSVDMMHDFKVDELNISTPVTKGGESSTVEFTATEAGTFEYYCSVGNHRQRGQIGTLIVEE